MMDMQPRNQSAFLPPKWLQRKRNIFSSIVRTLFSSVEFLDLRLRERFLVLGFLSKPEVFGGVGFP